MYDLCVICEETNADRLADSDSIQHQFGMPVCSDCFDENDMDEHEAPLY